MHCQLRMTFLDVDSTFDATRITRLRHQLVDHPLLGLAELTGLALRQQPRRVQVLNADAALGDPLRLEGSDEVARVLDALESSKVFVRITGLEDDARYRALINAFLDEVAACLPAEDRRFLAGDASVFIASPGAVMPFHLEHEQSFLCHLAGEKTLLAWDPRDRSLVSALALERFSRDGSRSDVRYQASFREKAHVFELRPGDAVFVPMHAPHAISTGAHVAATLCISMNTPSSLAELDAWRANGRLRQLGLRPAPVGRHRLRDQLKWRALRLGRQLRDLLSRAPAPHPQY